MTESTEPSGAPAPTGWPAPPPPPRPPASGARIADVTVSVILLLAGFVGFAMLAFVSVFLVMVSDGCYDDRCNTDLLSVGWIIAMFAPPLVFIAAIVWTLVRIARRKTSWWVPVLGAVVAAVAWGVGAGIMQASLGR
jgi:uncharacterized BrkB/YihY/UPF0761 family membrane protein